MVGKQLAGTWSVMLVFASFVFAPTWGSCVFRDCPTLGLVASLILSWSKSDMTQNQLVHDLARITGETVATIRHLGFSLADPDDISFDPERPRRRRRPHHTVNWDQLDAQREPYLPQRSRCRR